MALYKKLSEYLLESSPANGDLIPCISDDGSGNYTNVIIPYSSLKGAPGNDGVGLPTGGSTSQILRKTSSANYAVGWTSLTKSTVGLNQVDNTSDLNKPVSNATNAAIQAAVLAAVTQVKNDQYPVGSIYMNADDPTDPGVLLGMGVWTPYGEGRVPVGKAAIGTFATAGDIMGSETHRHTGYGTGGDLRAAIGAANGRADTLKYQTVGASDPATGSYPSAAGGGYTLNAANVSTSSYSHFTPVYGYVSTETTLQPSVVVYMWKRVS